MSALTILDCGQAVGLEVDRQGGDGLRRTNVWTLVPAGLVLALAVLLRAVRWRILLSPAYRPSTRVVLGALLIGSFFNTILPARAGEPARVLVLKQRAGTPRFAAAGTVGAEHVLVLLALFFASAPFVPRTDWLGRGLTLGAAGFVVLSVLVVAFAVYGQRPARLLLRPSPSCPGSRASGRRRAPRTSSAVSHSSAGAFRGYVRLEAYAPSPAGAASWSVASHGRRLARRVPLASRVAAMLRR